MSEKILVIPEKFNLLGHTIRVVYDTSLMSAGDRVGEARYLKNEIALQPQIEGINILRSDIEQSFCHELIYFILNFMNESELRKNEKFVDVFAGLLHQALVTAEGTK